MIKLKKFSDEVINPKVQKFIDQYLTNEELNKMKKKYNDLGGDKRIDVTRQLNNHKIIITYWDGSWRIYIDELGDKSLNGICTNPNMVRRSASKYLGKSVGLE